MSINWAEIWGSAMGGFLEVLTGGIPIIISVSDLKLDYEFSVKCLLLGVGISRTIYHIHQFGYMEQPSKCSIIKM